MRFQMKQRFLSWGDDYDIRDESGQVCFVADGRVFTLRNTLSLSDATGNEMAVITQRLLSLRKTYDITVRGQHLATVSKNLMTLFRCRFHVDVPGPDDLEAQGNFFDYEYTFQRGNEVVATVSKRWFSWTDSYGIEVSDSEDAVLIIASTIVIDQICHEDRGTGHS